MATQDEKITILRLICYKYRALLEDEDVARWVRNLERGSPITAEVSVRRLGKASNLVGLTPNEMMAHAKLE
jgi:hypothetical protein